MEKLIVGFLKVRNEIIRSGNIYRVLCNMQNYCDDIYVVDDASWDGTYEYLKTILPADHIIRVPPDEHDFRYELRFKQELLNLIHMDGPWKWILWMDADETLDAKGTEGIRQFCKEKLSAVENGYVFHYSQLWRTSNWARTDAGFDDGKFVKLWKWTPKLRFNIIDGTHHAQFPAQICRLAAAPFEVIHWGNFGVNLRWKAIQYWGGLGGVDRHLCFGANSTYRRLSDSLFPPGVERIPSKDPPQPFTQKQIDQIRLLKNLQGLEKTFCVVIPTHNRGYVLRRTLDSLINQTYTLWIAIVLDDASTDDTSEIMWEYQEKDPRFFYARYLNRSGGVAMNDLGMEAAVNTCEYWTRLGSDDWFFPTKLEYDYQALKKYDACYGPFVVNRNGKFAERCSLPFSPSKMREMFLNGGFEGSWVNVAAKTSMLKKVKEKFGNYVDLRLQNMEDRLFNFRLLKFCDIVWRGMVGDKFYVNPDEKEIMEIRANFNQATVDGAWSTDEKAGSSYNFAIYNRDTQLTTEIINVEKNL